ncbi:hypothetical protein D1AOALGA4SA_3896, partial [Olavius algarvensis Delta 1 endosymbiont]
NGGIAPLSHFKQTEYLKSKIRIPKSKICFSKFLLFDQTGCPLAGGRRSCETTFNLSLAEAQSSQRKASKIIIILAPLRLCEKIISFFCDQPGSLLAGGCRSFETTAYSKPFKYELTFCGSGLDSTELVAGRPRLPTWVIAVENRSHHL